MFKEIIDNILLAEKTAEGIEREASKKAQETGINAHNKADEYADAAEKEIKAAIKLIMLKASEEGEAKAAALINDSRGRHAQTVKAAEKNHKEAVGRIIREFLSSSNL